MRSALCVAILALAWLPALLPSAARSDEPNRAGQAGAAEQRGNAASDDATVHHGFADVERWVAVFDDPERDGWQRPDALVRALALRTGDVVADVGAGTGYFNPHWSRAVGPEGAVFAVDVEPGLVAHMRERAEAEGTANVIPVLGSLDHPRLPPGAVDLAVLVDSYHHIGARRDYFRRFRRFLAPGGRLAIVDWRRDREIPVGPPPEHRIAADRVARELADAGWAEIGRFDGLPYQYVRIFRPDAVAAGRGRPATLGERAP